MELGRFKPVIFAADNITVNLDEVGLLAWGIY
jgi:hypothetical protein